MDEVVDMGSSLGSSASTTISSVMTFCFCFSFFFRSFSWGADEMGREDMNNKSIPRGTAVSRCKL